MASVVAYTGLQPQVLNFLEAVTSGDFEDGDLVEIHTTGKVKIAVAGNVYGIARRKYTDAVNGVIPVEKINPNEIYVMKSDGTTDTNQIGLMVDITDFTPGAHLVDTTAGSTDEVTIVGLHPSDPSGTSGGRVLVTFNMDKIEERA